MKKFKQLIKHDPGKGQFGDCWRTVVACMLEIEPAKVPHFVDGEIHFREALRRTNDYLEDFGLALLTFDLFLKNQRELFEGYREFVAFGFPKCPEFLIWGTAPTGVGHVVIANEKGFVYDPLKDPGDDSEIILYPAAGRMLDNRVQDQYIIGHFITLNPAEIVGKVSDDIQWARKGF